MRSMFVKLFFWFWLATLLSGFIFFLLAINLRLSPRHGGPMRHFDQERRQLVIEALTLYGSNAAQLHERGLSFTPPAPAYRSHFNAYLFTAEGVPLSKETPPPLAATVRALAAKVGEVALHRDDLVLTRVTSSSGASYLAVAAGLPQMPPPPPLRGFHFPPDLWLQFLITFVISGLGCYLLAWRLTVPIRRLREAAQGLAEGKLEIRVAVADQGGDELADLARDFNSMAERIGKLLASHRQLLRDVSHELRSPLARLSVALGLARKAASPMAESSLSRIEQESERLNGLIGELLELSRLEGGSGTTSFADVELGRLVEEIVRDAEFEAQNAGKEVLITGTDPILLKGDRELLRRALENVVRNAVRYTAAGSAVEVSLAEVGGEARIRVRDHGPGVPESLLAEIFRPFFRVAEARDRTSGGTGIGLAISESTVALHGGRIVPRNMTEGGLEVEIILPTGRR